MILSLFFTLALAADPGASEHRFAESTDASGGKDCGPKRGCRHPDPEFMRRVHEADTDHNLELSDAELAVFVKNYGDEHGLTEEDRQKLTQRLQMMRESMRAMLLDKFDLDHNGVLDERERQQAHEHLKTVLANWQRKRDAFIKRHDANGDGKLDDKEMEAALRDRRASEVR